jgi:hypothetical protein
MATTKKTAKKAVKPKINDAREKYLKTLKALKKCEDDFTKFFPGKEINHNITEVNLIVDYAFSTTPQSDEIEVTIKTNAGAYFNFSFEKDAARGFAESILQDVEMDNYITDSDDEDDDSDVEDDGRSLEDIIAELEADLASTPDNKTTEEEEGPLKKFTVMGERNLNTAWTYKVIAHSSDEAIEMVQDCPDGLCENITHMDDENVYSDDIEYSVTDEEDIEEEKPKAKKAVPKKKK